MKKNWLLPVVAVVGVLVVVLIGWHKAQSPSDNVPITKANMGYLNAPMPQAAKDYMAHMNDKKKGGPGAPGGPPK